MKTVDVTGMAIYVAGKMTGDPFYRQKFHEVVDMLRRHGAIVLHTVDMQAGLGYESYMRVGFAMLCECDAIYLIGDWFDSSGARRERRVAEELGREVLCEGQVHIVGGEMGEY